MRENVRALNALAFRFRIGYMFRKIDATYVGSSLDYGVYLWNLYLKEAYRQVRMSVKMCC